MQHLGAPNKDLFNCQVCRACVVGSPAGLSVLIRVRSQDKNLHWFECPTNQWFVSTGISAKDLKLALHMTRAFLFVSCLGDIGTQLTLLQASQHNRAWQSMADIQMWSLCQVGSVQPRQGRFSVLVAVGASHATLQHGVQQYCANFILEFGGWFHQLKFKHLTTDTRCGLRGLPFSDLFPRIRVSTNTITM